MDQYQRSNKQTNKNINITSTSSISVIVYLMMCCQIHMIIVHIGMSGPRTLIKAKLHRKSSCLYLIYTFTLQITLCKIPMHKLNLSFSGQLPEKVTYNSLLIRKNSYEREDFILRITLHHTLSIVHIITQHHDIYQSNVMHDVYACDH